MIYGIGTDIVQVSRMKKWVQNAGLLERFFYHSEIKSGGSENFLCEHYAARFAAKEAFSKALGTGLVGFSLKDVFITNDDNGKPVLNVIDSAKKVLENLCGNCILHVSLSHEKEYATAFVVIER